MNNLGILLGTTFIIVGLINTYKIYFSWLRIRKDYECLEKEPFSPDQAPRIIILIPLLREQATVAETIDRFSKFAYPGNKLIVALITTEREFEKNTPRPNTIDILEAKLDNPEFSKRFIHVHYPHARGVKSDQLNYALRELQKTHRQAFSANTYIGVYDADSFSPANTLEVLAKKIQRNGYADIFQQPTLYLKNRKNFKGFPGLFTRSFSWIQTAYAFYEENFNLASYKPRSTRKLLYAVGHGIFIRWETLQSVNYFPTPIEDTRLGHVFSYLGKEFQILPVFDVVESAPGILTRIKQASVWFLGVSLFLKDMKLAEQYGKIDYPRAYSMAAYRFYRNAVWSTRAFLLWAVAMMVLDHPAISVLAVIVYLLIPVIYLMTNISGFNKVSANRIENLDARDWLSLIVAPVEFVFMSTGPLMGLLKRFIFRVTDERVLYPKTER
jgi:hypothetical protein